MKWDVPTIKEAATVDKETVIANIHMLEMNGKGIDVNKELTEIYKIVRKAIN